MEIRQATLMTIGCIAAFASCAAPIQTRSAADETDLILRGGTIVDGSGAARYRADIAIDSGRIRAIGDLQNQRARVELDVSGLIVAPGFINLHSHASPAGLQTAVNMLSQGVTTELLNPDGGGPLDIGQQLAARDSAGLAVNVGAYVAFNSIWARIVGATDQRPNAAQIDSMRAMVTANLEHGAWAVSAGLDYKPAYFSKVEEVIQILEPARKWRTNFTNHDRITPESGYSSRVGMLETIRIGEATGQIPVITHMKLQGREQGGAAAFLQAMNEYAARGVYVAADVYPYLAGQTSLAALIIPGWAQEGGRAAMLERFKDPAQRARIVKEAEEAMDARFSSKEGVYLPTLRKQLVDIMTEMRLTSHGETVVRILETSSPTTILRFGSEEDLVKLLQHPTSSIACDCGAVPTATHPRGFGTFPRVLGRYVREQKVLTWENAIRKMTALPAATIGMVDRGVIAVGMAADIVVFDSATVIDHATYENPTAPSEGIKHVLVNGQFALRDGQATGVRAGRALRRASYMPSRPLNSDQDRAASARGTLTLASGSTMSVSFDVSQAANDRRAKGSLRLRDERTNLQIDAITIGFVQTMENWATFSGLARVSDGTVRTFRVVADEKDPFLDGQPISITIEVDGMPTISAPLVVGTLEIHYR
jgi:N-acyl-D-amino-acid deacylase